MMTSPLPQLLPYDEFNQQLEANVHPPEWQHPTVSQPYHLVVIGAGTAGLVTASGAAQLGARVALIERDLMGGDCLNVGCVPSKALLAAARTAACIRDSSSHGISADNRHIDFSAIMQRMRRLRANISPADSAARFKKLGADVYFGQGSFLDAGTIQVTHADGTTSELKTKKTVIATGARASAPDIPGLDSVRVLNNETLFSLTELPKRLAIIGSGPIGCEMAQAFARFGSQVILFERGNRILPREDSDAAAIVQKALEQDGVQIQLESQDLQAAPNGEQRDQIVVRFKHDGEQVQVVVDELLVAAGRSPNTEGLNLEVAGVDYDEHGIKVNDFLQTSNPKIFAAGDICSKYKFTHAADFMARIVLQNSLFAVGPLGRRRASGLMIPWATYTAPEIAHVGLYQHEANEAGIEIDTYVQTMADVDRAILEGREEGFVKIHTKKGSDKILGATVVAENAGDLVSEITLAMTQKVGLGKIASVIHPYPTQADAIRKLGDQFNRTKLTPLSKRMLNLLRRINVGR